MDEWFMNMFLHVIIKRGYRFKIQDGWIYVEKED